MKYAGRHIDTINCDAPITYPEAVAVQTSRLPDGRSGERNIELRLFPDNTALASRVPSSGLSAELFLIPLTAARFLVYAPLRRAAFVGNAALVNLLCDLKEGLFAPERDPDGKSLEFLRHMEIIGAGPESLPVVTYEGDPEPTHVTLLLTTGCNLRCTYCYASSGDAPSRNMPLQVARRGIDFASTNAKRRGDPGFELAFHGGGEPTLNWKTLVDATEYARARARQLALDLRVTCATNGVLSDAKIDWIIANLQGASISFDGLPESHDKHRRTIAGKGSSHRVQHSIERCERANFPYGIRVTVTHDQIASLPDSLRHICTRFRPERIQVEPAYPMGRWSEAPSAETAAFIAAYRQARTIARELGQDLCYSAARLDTLTNHFCAVSQDGFSLTHDGRVTACYEVFSPDRPHADSFFYGRPTGDTEGYDFDANVLAGLRRLSVEHKPFCQGCFAKWHCAGDCHHRTLSSSHGGVIRGSERCYITRELIKDLILERIQEAGAGFWHELLPDPSPQQSRE